VSSNRFEEDPKGFEKTLGSYIFFRYNSVILFMERDTIVLRMKRVHQILSILILLGITSCRPAPILEPGQTLELAKSAENKVEVTIALTRDENGQFTLSATFTPQLLNMHLYSKETPRSGVEGVGRPTLLELAKDSALKANGELIENVFASQTSLKSNQLQVYPAGPVTLSLPVLLPDGNDWVNDEVIVTYMVCDDYGCHAPVEQKSIAIKIPGGDLFE
jgi:hypothetical protein